MQTYDFEIKIAFRITADNKHDALQAALAAEESLNTTSLHASYSGTTTLVRVKPPTMTRFRQTVTPMPNEPVTRSSKDEISRRGRYLMPLKDEYIVTLEKHGKQYRIPVTAPSREAAIDAAKAKLYHDKGHLAPTLLSVSLGNLTNSNDTEV
jgi:hypothetical protein